VNDEDGADESKGVADCVNAGLVALAVVPLHLTTCTLTGVAEELVPLKDTPISFKFIRRTALVDATSRTTTAEVVRVIPDVTATY
jgi:hypothetical protein